MKKSKSSNKRALNDKSNMSGHQLASEHSAGSKTLQKKRDGKL